MNMAAFPVLYTQYPMNRDLEAGFNCQVTAYPPDPDRALLSSIAARISEIDTNIHELLELIKQLGTSKDFSVANSIVTLAEAIWAKAKHIREDMKKFSVPQNMRSERLLNPALHKISKDFLLSLTGFQQAQKTYIEALSQRDQLTTEDDHKDDQTLCSKSDDGSSESDTTTIVHEPRIYLHNAAKNETSILGSDDTVPEIEKTVTELENISKEIDALVTEVTDEIRAHESLNQCLHMIVLIIFGLFGLGFLGAFIYTFIH